MILFYIHGNIIIFLIFHYQFNLYYNLYFSSKKALESQHFTSDAVNSLRRFSDSISLNDVDIDKKRLDEFRILVALSGKSGNSNLIRR